VQETKNHDLERDLYIEERKAERGVIWHQQCQALKKAPEALKRKLEYIDEQQREVWSNWRHRASARTAHMLGIAVKVVRLLARVPWIVVMFFYWALAGHGRSFVKPRRARFERVYLSLRLCCDPRAAHAASGHD